MEGSFLRLLASTALVCSGLTALNACDREPRAEENASIAKNGCLGCHATDKGMVSAPPFAAISERYAGSDATALLAESLRNGSHGKWGAGAMPAQSQLSEEEAKALVRSIVRR